MGSNIPMTTKQQPNPKQRLAIEKFSGPSLVIAGAGTGKTTVLTEKIKRLVIEKKVRPENILALTFTDKAAYEMEERVDKALPYGFFQTWIMTFHSFADSLLREFGMHIGLSPSYHLLSEAEAVMFFRKNLNSFELNYFYSTGNPTGFIDSVLGHFSRLRDENITPQEYQDYAGKLNAVALKSEEAELVDEANKTLELAALYQKYQELKLKENYLDFGDLIYYLVFLLAKRKNILREVQTRFSYGLVDEFQDTNIVQYQLIKLLFPPKNNPNLTLIGDDNQSIYKFRGASVSNILNFKEDYPQANIFVLNRNYRSYQEILDSSYRLIKFNNPDTLEVRLGINKELLANKGKLESANPQLLHAADADGEGELIVAKIKALLKDQKYLLSDFAILVRANDHAKPIIQALERNGLPYQFLGPALLYYKNEIRDLIALLKFLNDSADSASLYRVLSMPLIKIEKQQLVYLLSFGKRISRSLIEVLELLREFYAGVVNPELEKVRSYLPYLQAKDQEQLVKITELLLKLLQKGTRQSAIQVLYTFLEESGYLKVLSQINSVKDEEQLSNITRFFNRLKKMTGDYGEVTVREALNNINLALELGDSPKVQDFDFKEENAVNILTTHSAKGLEFKVVFLSNLVVDRFPTRRRGDKLPIPEALIKEKLPEGNYHLQEERRLFYVGMTRAEDRLFFSYADLYSGGKRQRKLSPFVSEALGEEQVKQFLGVENEVIQQLSIFETLKEKPNLIALSKAKPPLLRASYTQIEAYENCPQQYQYRYLIKVPEPESSALSFGSSVHRALELFYKDFLEKRPVTVKTLLEYFKSSFLPLGYLSRTHQERTFEKGRQILENYYQQFFDKTKEVFAVEKNFSLKLKVGERQYLIGGKIDRIDRIGDLYEIIDYKTGKMPLERELKKSLQLGIYALAATDQEFLNLKPEQIALTYIYLERGQKYTLSAATRDLKEVEHEVLSSLEKMATGKYPPVKSFRCDWCPFKIICPAWGN